MIVDDCSLVWSRHCVRFKLDFVAFCELISRLLSVFVWNNKLWWCRLLFDHHLDLRADDILAFVGQSFSFILLFSRCYLLHYLRCSRWHLFFRGRCLAFWCFPCLSLPIHVVISSLLSYIKKSSVFTFSPHTLYSAERNRSNHSYVMGLFHRLFASLHVIVTHKLFCGLDWCHSHHLLPINNISYEDTVHLTHCER